MQGFEVSRGAAGESAPSPITNYLGDVAGNKTCATWGVHDSDSDNDTNASNSKPSDIRGRVTRRVA